MSTLFSPRVSYPSTPPAPPSPVSEDPAVKAKTEKAMEEAASAERKVRGRASTIMTGGLDMDDDEAPTAKKYLMGT